MSDKMEYILDTNVVIGKNEIAINVKNNNKVRLSKKIEKQFKNGNVFITPFVYSEIYSQFWKGYSNYVYKSNDNDFSFLTKEEQEKAKSRIEIISKDFLKKIEKYVLKISKDTFSELVKTRPHIISNEISLKKLKDNAIAIEFNEIKGSKTFVTNNLKDFRELKQKNNVICSKKWEEIPVAEKTSKVNKIQIPQKFNNSVEVSDFISKIVNNEFDEWEINILENMVDYLSVETDGGDFIIEYDGSDGSSTEISINREKLSDDDTDAIESLIYNIVDIRKDFITIERERYE